MSNVLSIHVVLVTASVVRRERRLQSSKRERKPSAEAVLTAVLIDLDAVIFPTFGIHFIFTRSSESFATHKSTKARKRRISLRRAHHRVSSASERELLTRAQ